MLGRRQELNLQFLEIVDAFLVVLSFWAAHTFRYVGFGLGIFDSPIAVFKEFQWLLFVLVPFAPICLEARGFYEHAAHKTVGKSLGQIGRAGIVLGLVIAFSAYFLRLNVDSRAVMPLFALFASALLLLRERISIGRDSTGSD